MTKIEERRCVMDRPSKEQVDDALALWTATTAADRCHCRDCEAARVILAEVRALREELREWKDGERALREPGCECHQEEGDSECPVHDPRAKLARVEALPKFWRTLDVSSTEGLPEEGRWRLDRCADDLEAALRGDP